MVPNVQFMQGKHMTSLRVDSCGFGAPRVCTLPVQEREKLLTGTDSRERKSVWGIILVIFLVPKTRKGLNNVCPTLFLVHNLPF